MVERRIKKSLDSFDFKVIPSLNKALVLELASTSSAARTSSRSATGDRQDPHRPRSRPGGLPKGPLGGFITAAALVHELIEARDDKQLLRFQKKLATYKPDRRRTRLRAAVEDRRRAVVRGGQRYERGSRSLPFDEWTEVFGSERLRRAPRSTHHVNILEMNGDSYRLNQSRKTPTLTEPTTQPTLDPVGPQVPPARAAASAC